MKRTFTLHLLLLLGAMPCLFAQNSDAVLLHTGAVLFPENVKTYSASATVGSDEMVGGNYYRLLQFYVLPNQATFNLLSQHGIQLLEYIPHKTYVASIPTGFDAAKFSALGVRSIQPVTTTLKMAVEVRGNALPDWSVQKNRALLMLKFFKNIPHETALRYCSADGIEVLLSNGYNNFLKVAVPLNRVQALAKLPYVAFVEPIPAPSVPDDIYGRSLHRSNVIDAAFPGGRHYNGEGVSVLVRDDGGLGPHIDYQGRLDNSNTTALGGTHGDGVGGIIGGAGNLDPWMKGMAAGSSVYATDYEETFLDETMDLFFNKNVLVTNSSYSNGCNDGYTETTEVVDQQLYGNPTLMHVFSAGNSNGAECGYGAGSQWGNITGGHKQAKNCLTTANLYSNSLINESSSRGPAHDGRLKPDIAAHGAEQVSTDPDNTYQIFGGTSAASPGIAGIMVQLHHAHRLLNSGETANAALLKAILLNTANDLGNVGPDYIFGWGHVNAYRAALTLEDKRYLQASVDPGATAEHIISIPAGIKEARIMVYWADPAATIFTDKALVNDLDITLADSAEVVRQPWLLNPAPNAATLNTPATNGTDTLNNMEQIVLTEPVAGDYKLRVLGKELPFGTHSYYVIWEFRTPDITVTHPAGGEGFAPGETVRIHWDAIGSGGNFQVQYSADNGSSWNNVANVGGSGRMTDWTVPNSAVTGKAKIRVSRDGITGENDQVFSIAPRPGNVEVVKACPDYISLKWDAVSLGAASTTVAYEVLLLGDKYMEPVDTVTTAFADIPTIDLNPLLDHWFAVRTLGDDGIHSERTIAILHNAGLLACAQNVDIKLVSLDAPAAGNVFACGAVGLPVTVTVQNTGLTAQSNVPVSFELDAQPPVIEVIPGTLDPGETVTYTFAQGVTLVSSGDFHIRAGAAAPGELALFDNLIEHDFSVTVYPGIGEPLEYQEDFEGAAFPPPYFLVNNPDGSFTWDSIKVIGSDGDSSVCFWINNYDYNGQGALDDFLVVPIDLTDATGPQLTFDVAYARYPDYIDGLRVEVSTDCGASFTEVVYEKFGDQLETVPDQTSPFFPFAANQWRNEKVILTPYIGNSIVLKFVSINGFGNSLLVDNINIKNVAAPVASFTQNDTVICQGQSIIFTNATTGEDATFQWSFGTGTQPASSTTATSVTVKFNQHGTFTPTLTANNAGGQTTFTSEVIVEPLPVAAFSWVDNNDGTVTFTNQSQFGVTYLWDFGDTAGSPSGNPTVSHEYADNGTYTVKLTVSNGCGSKTISKVISVLNTPTQDLTGKLAAFVQPNPNAGKFDLVLESLELEQMQATLLDVRGVALQSQEIFMQAGRATAHFDAKDAAPGLYFLKIQAESGAMILKVNIL